MIIKDKLREKYNLYKNRFFVKKLMRIEIETTSICNLKCPYCPNSNVGRPHGLMDENTFNSALDSLARNKFSGHIAPHFYGEPLMDKRLVGFIISIRKMLPNAFIELFTNGILLTVEKYLELKDAGVNYFVITRHTEDSGEHISKVINEVKNKYPQKYNISYRDFFTEYNHQQYSVFSNRGGAIDIPVERKKYCYAVNQATIDYQGNMVLCCNDYSSTIKFGNIKENDLYEIWRHKKYIQIRKEIMNGNFLYEICKKCSNQQ